MKNKDFPFPDVLRIETVGFCNFNCVHCPTGTVPNKRQVLKPDRFDAILDQFRDAGYVPRVVVLYHGGEPLLNKNAAGYIRMLKEFGVEKTVITTNASLLTEERARDLILSGLDEMKVSFDGGTVEGNNAIRVNGDFSENAQNLIEFLQLKKVLNRDNPEVKIFNVRIFSEEAINEAQSKTWPIDSEMPQYIKEFFAPFADELEFRSFPAMVWPGFNQFGGFKQVAFSDVNPRYCGPLFETSTILSNGEVVPCCYDLAGKVVFGNIFETPWAEIWDSPQYRSFRDNFRDRNYHDLCRKCAHVRPAYLCKSKPELEAAVFL